ncbi:helix-turn-helix domain-containing protein [Tenacibaculum sp.]|uniref:helix-turn-helix domain-containing protein n=1 Tax=Tenacibaculum sp. TaxID=1906242 RepID=UPI003D1375F1
MQNNAQIVDVKRIRKALNLNQTDFGKKIGVSLRSVQMYEKGETKPSADVLIKILELDKQVSAHNEDVSNLRVSEPTETFKTKSGSIIDELPNGKYLLTVPLLPYKAHATYISEFQDADYISDLTKVSFIVDRVPRGRYMAFEIMNDSMNDATLEREPSRNAILNGDIVLGRELGKQHWKSKLNTNGYPYWIIVHKDTIVCKEIINHDVERGIITCHSLNGSPEFQDFDLKLDDCHQLFNIIKKQI